MPSDAASGDAASGQDATPEQYVQRAALLADLGRYDEAADELTPALAADPGNAETLALLARLRLAAKRPHEAILAGQQAVTADPGNLSARVTCGLALADLDRRAEAAQVAEELLRVAPDSGYAQTSAAAILVEVRNGQLAMDTAWRGAQLLPNEPKSHLVLGLVAARMELFDLAERAYREALRLDPDLAEVRFDVGLVRLEQRRYAEALERIAERIVRLPPVTTAAAGVAPATPLIQSLRGALRAGAGYALVAPVLAGWGAASGFGRGAAIVLCAAGFIGLAVFALRLSPEVRSLLPALIRGDRGLTIATVAVFAAPCLILLYAMIGSPWPLALAVAGGGVALLASIPRANPG